MCSVYTVVMQYALLNYGTGNLIQLLSNIYLKLTLILKYKHRNHKLFSNKNKREGIRAPAVSVGSEKGLEGSWKGFMGAGRGPWAQGGGGLWAQGRIRGLREEIRGLMEGTVGSGKDPWAQEGDCGLREGSMGSGMGLCRRLIGSVRDPCARKDVRGSGEYHPSRINILF